MYIYERKKIKILLFIPIFSKNRSKYKQIVPFYFCLKIFSLSNFLLSIRYSYSKKKEQEKIDKNMLY